MARVGSPHYHSHGWQTKLQPPKGPPQEQPLMERECYRIFSVIVPSHSYLTLLYNLTSKALSTFDVVLMLERVSPFGGLTDRGSSPSIHGVLYY